MLCMYIYIYVCIDYNVVDVDVCVYIYIAILSPVAPPGGRSVRQQNTSRLRRPRHPRPEVWDYFLVYSVTVFFPPVCRTMPCITYSAMYRLVS